MYILGNEEAVGLQTTGNLDKNSIENSADPLLDMVLSSVIIHFSIYISEVKVLLPSTPTWAVV